MGDKLTSSMGVLMTLSMISAMEGMGREFIRPELEKRLGHPLTEYDWQVYFQESANKEQQAPWRNLVTQFQQQIVDQEVIRAFVWEGR